MPPSKLSVGSKLMKNIFLALASFFLLSVNSYAVTGTDLKKYLIDFNSSSSTLWGSYGVGYVIGVVDMGNGLLFCAPQMTNKDITSVVLAYLFANSDKLEKTADVLVTKAMATKWPCKSDGNSTQAPVHKPTPKPVPKSDSPF